MLCLLFASALTASCQPFSSEPRYIYTVVTTTPPGAVSQKPDGKTGEIVTRDRFSIVVTGVEEAGEYGRYTPEEGNRFIAVEVVIESRTNQRFDINPLYARLQDADGKAYFLFLGGKEPSFQPLHKAVKGSRQQGWMTFEVPQDAEGFVLIYEVPFSSPVERAIIDLGR